MPYIKDHRREVLDPHLNKIMQNITTPGDIAYCVYRLALYGTPNTYPGLAQTIGILETCKLEVQRQIVEPYEDEKIRTNGGI